MKNLVIFSSANPNGNTAKLVEEVAVHSQLEVVALESLNITAYNYQNEYPMDDFYELLEKILAADNVIFASPVYWYSSTALMKAFIDRLTEVLDVPELKNKAKALKGKSVLLLATSSKAQLCPIFRGFFESIFSYFKMNYGGFLHVNSKGGWHLEKAQLVQFSDALKTSLR